jgi:hypothetical protein
MRITAVLLLVALLCGAAFTATTTALAPLTSAVDARLAAIDGDTRRERHDRRVLDRVAATLAEPTTSLAGDLDVARRAARRIARGLRHDDELKSLAADAVAGMELLARDDRSRLGAWAGRLPDPLTEPVFAAALAAVDQRLDRAGDLSGTAGRARQLALACLRMDETRDAFGVWGEPPPLPEAMPDFALTDVNPASPTHDQQVSPRDYLGKVSAWYFGRAG